MDIIQHVINCAPPKLEPNPTPQALRVWHLMFRKVKYSGAAEEAVSEGWERHTYTLIHRK